MKLVAAGLTMAVILLIAGPARADDALPQRVLVEHPKVVVAPLNFFPRPSPAPVSAIRPVLGSGSYVGKTYEKLPTFIRTLKVSRNRIIFTFKV